MTFSPARPAPFAKLYEKLMTHAKGGGEDAAAAAKRAGALAAGIDNPKAEAAFRLALQLDPLDGAPRVALSRLAAEAGDLDAAWRAAGEAFGAAIDEGDRTLAAFVLGEIAEARGDGESARQAFMAARTLAETVLKNDPHDLSAALDLAAARQRLAELDLADGDEANARAGHEAAYALFAALADGPRSDAALKADCAFSAARLADLALARGDLGAAKTHILQAEGFYGAIGAPREPGLIEARAALLSIKAEIARREGAFDEARAAMNSAVAARVARAAEDPTQRGALLMAWRQDAALAAQAGDGPRAQAARQQARALAQTLADVAADNDAAARVRLVTLFETGAGALAAGAIEEARRDLADAVRLADDRLANAPDDRARTDELAAAWDRLADVALAAGEAEGAEGALARAAHLARRAVDLAPGEYRAARNLAAALAKAGDAARNAGRNDVARAALMDSYRIRLDLAEKKPDDPQRLLDLAVVLERLGLTAQSAGDSVSARAAWEDELTLADRIFPEITAQGLRFRAVVRAHLASLRAPDAADHRKAALDALDLLAASSALTRADAALRAQLWNGA